MKSRPLLLAFALLAGCSSSDARPGGGVGGGSDGAGGGSDGSDAGGTGGSMDRDGGAHDLSIGGGGPDLAAPPLPVCKESCSVAADCATPSLALYDASHYVCNAGICAWLGCQSNSDCTAAYQKSNYACGSVPGLAMPSCYETCSAAADCATPSIALYDASHYACNGGRCDWLGCAADSDCTAAYQKSNYACGNVPGVTVPTCYETCGAPADCATPSLALYDSSHYACTAGRCAWLGCRASSECTAAFQKSNYVCQ